MSQQRLTESQDKTQQRIAPRKTSPPSAQSLPGGLHPSLQLQRMLGNRRVAQLIQAKRLTPEGKMIGFQRKLTVGPADDPYEQEADRVAHHVMNTSDAVAANSMQRAMSPEEDKDQTLQTKPLATSITPFMQREMVENEGSEDKEQPVQAKLLTETSREPLQRQLEAEEEETEPLQAKSAGALTESFEAGADVETQVSQSKGRGSPLPDPVRAYMEPRFGVDFSQVRVHTGSDALQMNQAVGAQAFTHGSDIYFGAGSSPTNLELTAHELTHVVQQTGEAPLQTKKQEQPGAPLALRHLSNGVVLRVPQANTPCPTCAANQEEMGQRPAHQEGGAPSERGKGPLNFLSIYVQRSAIQRDGEVAAPAGTTAPPTTAPTPGGQPAASKSATITLKAYYQEIPGQAKDAVKQAKGDNVMWLGLEMDSDYPLVDNKRIDQIGLAAGAPMVVDKYPAPISEGDDSVGLGGITAQLKYAGSRENSFDVKIDGLKANVGKAKKAAKDFLVNRMRQFGDIDALAKEAEVHLSDAFPGAKVSIKTLPNMMFDAGRSKFHYKVRGDSLISMEMNAVPVGEREVTVSGGTTVGTSKEDESTQRDTRQTGQTDIKKDVKDSERTVQQSTESVTVNYNKAVVHTIEDYVNKATTMHKEVNEDLAKKVVTDSDYHENKNWSQDGTSKTTVDNYTKNVKSGQKDEENFASKVSRWLGGAKKLLDFPLGWIPGKPGKIVRRLKNWWVGPAIDAGKWVADQFAVKGKVDYTDETITRTTTDKTDPTGGHSGTDVTRHDTEETTAHLTKVLTSTTKDAWDRHLKDVTTTTEEYKSLITKVSTGATDKSQSEDYSQKDKTEGTEATKRHKEAENKVVTTGFSSTFKWKFTKPSITATVVTGDAEVKATPFNLDAADKAETK